MSFSEYKETISEGDTVILFLGHNSMQTVTVTPGKVHQTKYGALPHSDMIGRQFGTKMFSLNKKGWVYLLHPTPELWTVNLLHRTQILYTTDISMVILRLALKPGSVVVESGTGSGSMSHSLIRTIAPSGHLHTFEFHSERADIARKEFESHKISHLVSVRCRDVCKEGFGLNQVADAVFLDLPAPWEAIQSSKEALKAEGGRLCSFSPCIEQVQRTCESLRSCGFRDITVMECLSRTFEVKTVPLQVPYLGPGDCQLFQEDAVNSLSRKRKLDVESNKPDVVTQKNSSSFQDDPTNTGDIIMASRSNHDSSEEKVLVENEEMNLPKSGKICEEEASPSFRKKFTDTDPATGLVRNVRAIISQKANKTNILTGRPLKDMTGHTGYLTFATLHAQCVTADHKSEEQENE
ncbi:tRNA (adenine(58)-N(1))-methyltransferase catalytic subunit TRMT61A-like [Porites lutea]|uniref:tRNA (adenine(58)-N(1))-methyltransferase catalytic subunit TRMT61A-like n=1 Tax=Porites lutea TaxID=51062 RepID=UPI003CC50C64